MPSRDLTKLSDRQLHAHIRDCLKRAQQSLRVFKECGDALLEAMSRAKKKGQNWSDWLAKNKYPVSTQQEQKYRKISAHWRLVEPVYKKNPELSLEEAYALCPSSRPSHTLPDEVERTKQPKSPAALATSRAKSSVAKQLDAKTDRVKELAEASGLLPTYQHKALTETDELFSLIKPAFDKFEKSKKREADEQAMKQAVLTACQNKPWTDGQSAAIAGLLRGIWIKGDAVYVSTRAVLLELLKAPDTPPAPKTHRPKLYFSGGSDIPEKLLAEKGIKCRIMPSFYSNVKNGKPDARFCRMLDGTTPVHSIFLDSGAHSLHNQPADDFSAYVDQYSDFVIRHKDKLDYYANVDVIFDPIKTWEVQQYLEGKGLKPVPVIHANTDIKWAEKYLKAGYKFIALGGLGQDVRAEDWARWAETSGVYQLLVDAKVKLHAFAFTAWALSKRFPMWSVDSTTWMEVAKNGSIIVPNKFGSRFSFELPWEQVLVSDEPNARADQHFDKLGYFKQELVSEWLNRIHMTVDDVRNSYEQRAKANVLFFAQMQTKKI
ncbi:MAG: hypothetical protein AB7K24_11400 [Gemmataceae bacterium]